MDYLITPAMQRKLIYLTALHSPTSAHLASSFSCVEILTALYQGNVLHIDPNDPENPDRSRFILSKGHGSLALYVNLMARGFISRGELNTFCQPGSRLGGEPTQDVPGVEAVTGSLGHGLSFGLGMATALKMKGSDAHTFVLLGDGESEEGIIWEAAMAASHFGLGNLTVILDDNRVQKMGFTEDIMGIRNWHERWHAFGWNVIEVDGHDVNALVTCLNSTVIPNIPRIIIAHTVKGKGVSLMENNPEWHWRMPNRRETKVFLRELGITEEEVNMCR